MSDCRRSLVSPKGVLAASLIAGFALMSGCGDSGPEFSIVSGSENQILEPIVMRFCKDRGATCTMHYAGSLDIGLSLEAGTELKDDAVWPASSVWIDMFDSERRVKHLASIAQTPVILGVRRSKAESLGWVGRPVSMDDILAAVNAGVLRFLMTSATQSNSGASAFLAMLSSAIGGNDVIEPGDLDDPAVRGKVRALLRGVERSAGSSAWLADLYVEAAGQRLAYDAMWNYEAVLKETNDTLRAKGQELLYAVYPTDGVAMADSPLGFVERGRGEDVEAFFLALQVYLQSPEIAAEIAATGRRIPLGGAPPAPADGDWNFDAAKLVTAIRMPEPSVIRAALKLYQEALRRPSRTALCLDFSGSMSGDGEVALKRAAQFLFTPERAAQVLVQWSLDDRITVIPFDGVTRPATSGSGSPEDQRRLLAAVEANEAGGGTDMYACAKEALASFGETRAGETRAGESGGEDTLPAILLMTDGRSDGDAAGFEADWRRQGSRVPVFGITFGDADKTQLDAIAAATSARVFDGTKDLVGAFRAARGYN